MVVIDTSVVFKWFDANESNRDKALEILQKHLLKEQEIIIPDLLLYEVTNAWSTKSALTIDDLHANMNALQKYALNIRQIGFELLPLISKMAKEYRVSAYDATYAVLAQERKCVLITADSKFVEQVNLPFVKNLSSYSYI